MTTQTKRRTMTARASQTDFVVDTGVGTSESTCSGTRRSSCNSIIHFKNVPKRMLRRFSCEQ